MLKRYEKSLLKEVKVVMGRRGYKDDIPLLKELTDSYEYNNQRILTKIKYYKVTGMVLLFAIPILSTLMAFAVNMVKDQETATVLGVLAGLVPFLSLSLALLTVLNSILKPSLRFTRSCQIGIKLFHWRCAFLEELELLDPLDDKSLVGCLKKQCDAFRTIQEEQISLALPDLHEQ